MSGPKNIASDNVHASKYRGENESYREAMNRIAASLADSDAHFREFRHLLLEQKFLPAGRIQAAIGSLKNITPYNCFVMSTMHDSFTDGPTEKELALLGEGEHPSRSIMDVAKEAAITMRQGGGVGYDISTLRPRGDFIRGVQSTTDGPMAFAPIFDAICKATSSAGNRRGAQMLVMRCDHPDIETFIRAKQLDQKVPDKYKPLSGFNMSVGITDELMECKESNKPFALRFNGQKYREVDPHYLWDMIMRGTYDWAEPGVLFLDTINRMNNLYYCEQIAATNPCVSGDTEILTKEYGYERIDSLLDKRVHVWNGEEWSMVQPKETGRDQPMRQLAFSDGSDLTCTEYHSFMLAGGEKIEAKDLKVGMELMTCEFPVIDGVENWELAYQQGFFSGDGWRDQRGRDYIGLYGEKQALRSHFEEYAFSIREYEVNAGWGTNYDTKLYAYMGKDVMKPKDYVPGVEWTVKARLQWLAGIADSDGTSCKGHVQITAKDRAFLMKIKFMLNTLGTSGRIAPMKDYWRLLIKASAVYHLQELGFETHRLVLRETPCRKLKTKLLVTSNDSAPMEAIVYCFDEPKKHMGVFGGIYCAQCGEQPLPPYGACLLGSINLVKYLIREGAVWAFDYSQLAKDIPSIVRAMDNVIDKARYPLYAQEKESKNKRRMGIGYTGQANAIEACGFAYGSVGYLEMADTIGRLITRECYLASVELAKEKGEFPLYDDILYNDGEFIKTLDEHVREQIKKHGIRNSHLTSIAPTGTISFCADNVSSGIEPVFGFSQKRNIIMPDGKISVDVPDYGVEYLGSRGKKAEFVTTEEHVSVLTTVQKHVDSAVSKTCNVPTDYPYEKFVQIYDSAYEKGAKGCTTYRPNGNYESVISSNDGAACGWDPVTGKRTGSCAD